LERAVSEDFIREITELPRDPLGGASGEKRLFAVEFLGKTNNEMFPYTVANEVVASQIGKALGLNLPTVLTHSIGNEDCALVHRVKRDPKMQQSPPATTRALANYVEENKHEVHGAIIFDLYMANNDRAFGPFRRNLFLDADGHLLLYDNGNACFYRNRPTRGIQAGIPRLEAVEAELTAMFDMDHKENQYRQLLTNWELVREWCDRIARIPDYLIESAVSQIPANSAGQAERRRLVEFLSKRRDYLYDHIRLNVDKFPGLRGETEDW
jgi:hypothetical protein